MPLAPSDLQALRQAKILLEHPGLAAKASNLLGSPIEKGLAMLPGQWADKVGDATRKAIEVALSTALRTMDADTPKAPSNWWHKSAVFASGAVGGAFGVPALAVELPVSTTIIMRSIADIARSEGEDLSSHNVRLQCVQVLALGGAAKHDDAAETGYFAARAALSEAITAAAKHLAAGGLNSKMAPPLIRLITDIAARFSIVVTEKAAAQAIPLVGAAGGALINTLFISHFQDMARGHFTVRRLERLYGPERVKEAYAALE
ncbi:EcsC family protein [Pigmentiphaga aceris]|uniref:EcsC family protein n=1 Tax=Pigmentiphaga aceris TaxID=1940612 RepID=A0A5C0B0D6_9BURK|nr:EcsC family protein [Pigmentiphaga aceris]QEI07416.1 EcsC family protein [Pigmentiphaga aceris]